MNAVDIIILSVLAAAVAAAVAFIIKRRKNGKCCSCGCDNCNLNCHKKQK